MPGIVLHRAHLGRGSKGVRHAFGGALIVGRKSDPDVAVVEDSVVRPVGAFELVQALGDQKAANAIACHEGKLALKKIQPPERCKLVEHQKQLLSSPIGVQALGQSPSDLIKHKPHQGFCAGDVGWRDDKKERDGPGSVNEIADAPVAPSRDLGDDGIAIEPQETHRG